MMIIEENENKAAETKRVELKRTVGVFSGVSLILGLYISKEN